MWTKEKLLKSCRISNKISINKEKMKIFAEKTMAYEAYILKNLDKSRVKKDVLEVINDFICYKKRGIPYIFQKLSYRKAGQKIKVIKLFNIKIFQY